MMRMREGMVLRMMEMMTFEKAVMMVTASPMTMAGFNCDVTANAEQMPNTCTMMGLSRFSGLTKTSLFSFENNLLIMYVSVICWLKTQDTSRVLRQACRSRRCL